MPSRPFVRIFLFSLLPFAIAVAQSDELLSMSTEGTSKEESSVSAAREIQATVLAEAARAKVQEMIGEKRFAKSRALIESKIIRQSAKFIPFVNPAPAVQQPDKSWKMTVEFKISMSSLRKMIFDAGLMVDSEGPASVLPLVSFIDRSRNSSLRWWVGESKDDSTKMLSQMSQVFHEVFQNELAKQGFHLLKPQGRQISPVPEAYRIDQPVASDQLLMSNYFQAPLILRGDVRFKEMKDGGAVGVTALKLQIVQANSGRIIAESSRQIETDPGTSIEGSMRSRFSGEVPELAKEIATQVYDAWQRGTLNTEQIRIVLNGKLTPKQLSEFKSALVSQLPEVKSVRERVLEAEQSQFDIDFSGERSILFERLKKLTLGSLEMRLGSVAESVVFLDVRVK